MPTSRLTEAKMTKAIRAWKDAGLEVGSVEIAPDGTFKILAPKDESPLPSTAIERETANCDEIFGLPSEAKSN